MFRKAFYDTQYSVTPFLIDYLNSEHHEWLIGKAFYDAQWSVTPFLIDYFNSDHNEWLIKKAFYARW